MSSCDRGWVTQRSRSRSAWENTIFENAALRQHNCESLSKTKNCAFLCAFWRCAESFITTCGWIHLVLNVVTNSFCEECMVLFLAFTPAVWWMSFIKTAKNNKTHVFSMSSDRNTWTSTFWRMKSASITPLIMLIRISYLLQFGLLHNFTFTDQLNIFLKNI